MSLSLCDYNCAYLCIIAQVIVCCVCCAGKIIHDKLTAWQQHADFQLLYNISCNECT